MNEDHIRRALDLLTEDAENVVELELASPARNKQIERVEALQRRARPWVRDRNVQALGIGNKQTKGDDVGELVLRVYVATKKPRAMLEAPVPSRVAIPGLGDVRTDVIEIGRLRLQSFRGRARPASPGVGIGHANVTAGTLGCIVARTDADGLFALGNAHILADSGRATIGDPIFQPAPADAPTSDENILGKLTAFVPLQFSSSGHPNRVDAAIAKVPAAKVRREIRLLGIRPTALVTEPHRGMRVHKVGRTTDHTHATIEDVDIKVAARYPVGSGTRRAGFAKQVACTRFTDDGDSGAVVLTEDDELVGLHFMGSDGMSIFNPISFVFDALRLSLA